MVVKNKYEFEIYFIYTTYRNNTFYFMWRFSRFFTSDFFNNLTGSFGLILLRSSININDIKELASEPNEWVYKKIAGLLLIIPGFFTDLLGLICIMKHLRSMVWNLLVSKKFINQMMEEILSM